MKLSCNKKIAHLKDLYTVAGALGVSVFAARLLGSSPGWSWWPTLALTVWILYMGDHLVHVFRKRKKSRREVPRFVYENRRNLAWTFAGITAADAFLILNFLKREVLAASLVLAGAALLFFAFRNVFRKRRKHLIPGEFFVLLFFLGSTWLGPFVTRSEPLLPVHGLVLLIMAGVVWMNLGIISLYDSTRATRLGISSMVHVLGKRATRSLIMYTGFLIYLMCAVPFLVFGAEGISRFVIIQAGMTTLLLLVLYLPDYFSRDDRYRVSADAILLLGFLALLPGD